MLVLFLWTPKSHTLFHSSFPFKILWVFLISVCRIFLNDVRSKHTSLHNCGCSSVSKLVGIIPKLCTRLCSILTGVTALKWACHVFSLPREMTPPTSSGFCNPLLTSPSRFIPSYSTPRGELSCIRMDTLSFTRF